MGGSACSSPGFSAGTQTSSGSVTISDTAGNTNTCNYKVTSYAVYRTRTWNSCKTGNDCVGGYVWDPCHSTHSECVGGNVTSCTTTHKSTIGIDCSGTVENDIVAGSWHYYDCKVCTTSWDSCKSTKSVCDGGNVWDSCKSRTPCVGGWNAWGGWTRTYCAASDSCEHNTMYHGG